MSDSPTNRLHSLTAAPLIFVGVVVLAFFALLGSGQPEPTPSTCTSSTTTPDPCITPKPSTDQPGDPR